MGELFDSAVGVAAVLVGVVVLMLIAYELFGPQAIGLPAIIGALALVGLLKLVSDAGLGNAGLAIVAVGVIAMPFVIGMAMKLGAPPGTRAGTEVKTPEAPVESADTTPTRRSS
jgi:hypothetical protein